MKILVIEDDAETATHVGQALRAEGYEVDESHSGIEGLARARVGSYAALVVDRMLPGMEGLALVKQLREEAHQVPVLFLTTMSGIDDRIVGLEGGGDDYLAKPFALREMVARVGAIARRHPAQTVLRAGDIEMDLLARKVSRGGVPITLQAQEFRLLEYLMRNAGHVVTRTMLLENVWDLHFDPRTKVVETHMSRLRSKINRGNARECIQTIRTAGYLLCAE